MASSLAQGRVTLLRDQLSALSAHTASFSNVFKVTLKRVVANISDLVDNVIGPMGQKKVSAFRTLIVVEYSAIIV